MGFEAYAAGKFKGIKVRHNQTGEEEVITGDGAFRKYPKQRAKQPSIAPKVLQVA